MSGRRLLDAAKLLSASRAVAWKHLDLRSQQLDTYSKTSTVAKTVKSQTDRVTLTVKAAIALAQRFNEAPPSYASGNSAQRDDRVDPATTPERTRNRDKSGLEDVNISSNGQRGEEFEFSNPQTPLRKGEPEAKQDIFEATTLPDGTVPVSSTGEATSNVSGERGGNEFQGTPDPTVTRSSPFSDPRVSQQTTQPIHSNKTPDSAIRPEVDSSVTVSSERSTSDSMDDVPEGIDVGVFRTRRGAGLLGGAVREREELVKELQDKTAIRRSQDGNAHENTSTIDSNTLSPKLDATESAPQTKYQLRESRVPSSRLGRIWQYSGLATSMAFGAVGEGLRRVTGTGDSNSIVLGPNNMERLVAKLSRMRGAALKLGQIISFQDSKVLPPQIHEVLLRVQDSADYMPASQRDKVLSKNLGKDWRDLFSSFDDIPIAAASIGQVHKAVLRSSGKHVAVKVQYPGVASSIDSDLNNLSMLLTASRLLPKGLFLDKTIANARTELGWECDYIREAECQRRFKQLLADDTETYTVPAVISEASGKEVLTGELMTGTAVTKIPSLTQEDRDWLGTHILRLCLREITDFKFMQSDPNWTNFLYNKKSRKLELLDFGASRDYPDEFIEPYVNVLIAASRADREAVREYSLQLGYLTGHEGKAMLDAHIQSVLTLAEPFSTSSPEIYDFRDQTITDRVRELIPVMIRERLSPPPEETYSLHRKLSGAFLLCAKLGSRVPCRELFRNATANYESPTQLE